MQIVDTLLKYFQDHGEYIFDREILECSLFFNTACAMGLKNIRITRETNKGKKEIIPSIFAIVLANSGAGKNMSRDLGRSLFEEQFKSFSGRIDAFTDSRKDDDGKFDKRYIRLTDYYVPITSSVQGMQKAAQTLSDSGVGSCNCVSDEFADLILASEPIFTKLKTAWDSGVSEGQVNVQESGENYFTVSGVQYNMLLLGSPAPFELDIKKKDKLLEVYVSGMARRSFIFHNATYKKSENRNQDFETMSQEKIEEIEDYKKELRSFINSTKEIIFPPEIRKKLVEYDIQKESIRENSNSLIAEDLGSIKKIEKLLGILACLDLSDTINDEHLKYAISFTERTDKTAEETVAIKPIYIQIYNELEKRSFTARTDIIKAVRNVTLSTLDNEMVLVEEHANMIGNSIIKKENSGIVRYKLEKLSENSLDSISLSKNTNMSEKEPKGFKRIQGSFFNLHKIINSNCRYSAGTFLNEYITDDNYLSDQNLFVIDVDDGMSLEEAKSLFGTMTYLITTTKSHQKDKHGLVCDRFRIVFPTISKFHLSPSVYREMYMNVLNSLGMEEADTKCKNSSRWYFGNPNGEHWYNEGDMLDIRNFIPDTTQQSDGESNIERYEASGADTDNRLDGAMRWFLANTSNGNRNDMIFRFGMLVKDPNKIGESNWEPWVRQFYSYLEPFKKKMEIESIIRSISRK